MRWSIAALAALILSAPAALARQPQVGDTYEITKSYETSSQDSGGSSSSSRGSDAITERVIAVREDGLELEYDVWTGATVEDRARNWQFPARVFKPRQGASQLLHRPELEARLEQWLSRANLPRTACGRLIFTWNAFRIECDPQAIIAGLESYDVVRGELRDGALDGDPQAIAPAPLRRTATGSQGATFFVELSVNLAVLQQERADADMAVAEISRTPLTREAALAAHSTEQISGTIRLTIDTDAIGQARRRTRVTNLEIRQADGTVETRRATEVLERRLVRGGTP